MWQDLISTALIGTQRHQNEISINSSSENLNSLLTQINVSNDTEQKLLSLAVTLSVYQKTGQLPSKTTLNKLEPADLDDLPVCKAAYAVLLQTLGGKHRNVFPEAINLLAKLGKRVPPDMLFPLLEYGKVLEDSHPTIRQIIGKRGQWLASLNPNWKYAQTPISTETSIEERWKTGDRYIRIELLSNLRKTNPDQARDLLLTSWKQESADSRLRFISVLETNLSDDDEAFLEAALDDRSKDVRIRATQLLACLPNSQFQARMQQYARSFIQLKVQKKKIILEIEVPPITKELVRDYPFIEDNNSKGTVLNSIFTKVVPDFWCKEGDISWLELMNLIEKSDWHHQMESGLLQSLSNHPNLDLLTTHLKYLFSKRKNLSRSVPQNTFSKLSNEEKETLIIFVLDHIPVISDENIFLINLLTPKPSTYWSEELSRKLLGATLAAIRENQKPSYALLHWFNTYAIYLPPSQSSKEASELFKPEIFSEEWKAWGKALEEFKDTLEFRFNMFKEFNL
ncbi:MAG: DUF5691 domain-containing protein [Blastocatellia bacterium]